MERLPRCLRFYVQLQEPLLQFGPAKRMDAELHNPGIAPATVNRRFNQCISEFRAELRMAGYELHKLRTVWDQIWRIEGRI